MVIRVHCRRHFVLLRTDNRRRRLLDHGLPRLRDQQHLLDSSLWLPCSRSVQPMNDVCRGKWKNTLCINRWSRVKKWGLLRSFVTRFGHPKCPKTLTWVIVTPGLFNVDFRLPSGLYNFVSSLQWALRALLQAGSAHWWISGELPAIHY